MPDVLKNWKKNSNNAKATYNTEEEGGILSEEDISLNTQTCLLEFSFPEYHP